jgi:hypothetical protein
LVLRSRGGSTSDPATYLSCVILSIFVLTGSLIEASSVARIFDFIGLPVKQAGYGIRVEPKSVVRFGSFAKLMATIGETLFSHFETPHTMLLLAKPKSVCSALQRDLKRQISLRADLALGDR